MSEVTHILTQLERGDPRAAEQLLPLVYDELKKLAAQRMAREKPGQTLQATALVHEAYMKLVAGEHPAGSELSSSSERRGVSPIEERRGVSPTCEAQSQRFNSRGHFFAAAAEAMRRILVDNARRKHSLKAGGGLLRHDVDDMQIAHPEPAEELLALDEALDALAEADKTAAELVRLRYFAGLSIPEAAEILQISPRTADRLWAYARAWLHQEIHARG